MKPTFLFVVRQAAASAAMEVEGEDAEVGESASNGLGRQICFFLGGVDFQQTLGFTPYPGLGNPIHWQDQRCCNGTAQPDALPGEVEKPHGPHDGFPWEMVDLYTYVFLITYNPT